MGEVERNRMKMELIIRSVFYFYGDASSENWAQQIALDIQNHWNEPRATVKLRKDEYLVRFEIKGIWEPGINPEKIWYNDHPQCNYFRIEEFVAGNISFVDGIGCNTGYFKADNLRQTSTTAAHEYGHTIGLVHPTITDIRGTGGAGIMYPRGTLCDPNLQYDPAAVPATPGGTLNPHHRKVSSGDIINLQLHKLDFNEHGYAKLGEFTSVYHDKHVPEN